MMTNGTSAAEPDRQYSPTEDTTARRAAWTPPEIVAVVLLASTVLTVAATMFEFRGFVNGWRDSILPWIEWAGEPYVHIALVLASLIAWYLMTVSRDGLFAADDSGNDGVPHGESDDPDAVGIAELWDRGRRAVVIAGLAALCGAITALAVTVLAIDIESPGPGQIIYSHAGGVLLGLGGLVPAVTTVVIFQHVRDIWRDLIYTEEPADTPLDVPS
jgi:hypothetical protein